jgi:hypothetical protein
MYSRASVTMSDYIANHSDICECMELGEGGDRESYYVVTMSYGVAIVPSVEMISMYAFEMFCCVSEFG